jgi:hypothetical protein
LGNIPRIKFLWLSFVVFGALAQFRAPLRVDEGSWDSISASSVVNSHYLDSTIEQKDVYSDDEDSNASAYIGGRSVLPVINLYYQTYLNSINSFHYI